MAHTRSAEKHQRQSEKRRLRNKATQRAIKKQVRNVLESAQAGPADQLRKDFVLAVKKLDKAAAKRVIHPNAVARKKSQLARLLNAKSAAAK